MPRGGLTFPMGSCQQEWLAKSVAMQTYVRTRVDVDVPILYLDKMNNKHFADAVAKDEHTKWHHRLVATQETLHQQRTIGNKCHRKSPRHGIDRYPAKNRFNRIFAVSRRASEQQIFCARCHWCFKNYQHQKRYPIFADTQTGMVAPMASMVGNYLSGYLGRLNPKGRL